MSYINFLLESLQTWDYEKFDKIYMDFYNGKIERKVEDIPRLFSILANENPEWYMEPHQHLKISKMIFFLMADNNYNEAIYVFLNELSTMLEKQKDHAILLMTMLTSELKESEKMKIFVLVFATLEISLQERIIEAYREICNMETFKNITDKILENIEKRK